MSTRHERRTFSEDFKKQMVQLYNIGKPRTEIIREYNLTASAFDKWVKRINASGSSRAKVNKTPEEMEWLRLRKVNNQLRMENDILKQAALIFA